MANEIPETSEGCKRVLVCGGRDFSDRDAVFNRLDHENAIAPIDAIIQGGAPGADSLARDWARSRNVFCMNYPADWRKHGRAAGPLRNQQMLDEGQPTQVIAFSGGAGTADMIRRAKQAGFKTS